MAGKKRNQNQAVGTGAATTAKKSHKNRVVKQRTREIPWLAVIVGGMLLAGAVGLGVWGWQGAHPAGVSAQSTGASINGITCGAETTAVHYHMHLDLVLNGNPMGMPADIGHGANNTCIYWLHTHDTTGLIHIEAPQASASRVFTLGDLFAVWGQPLDARHVGNYALAPAETVTAYVNGVKWTGDLKAVPLKEHSEVVLDITSGSGPIPSPRASYNFPAGT